MHCDCVVQNKILIFVQICVEKIIFVLKKNNNICFEINKFAFKIKILNTLSINIVFLLFSFVNNLCIVIAWYKKSFNICVEKIIFVVKKNNNIFFEINTFAFKM